MITEEMESLKKTNYVRIAQAKNNYWVDFSRKKLNGLYIKNFGYNFKVIVHANDTLDEDYYVIPFEKIRFLFEDKYLTIEKNNPIGRRWVANIKNHILKVSRCPIKVDIKEYYSNKFWLIENSTTDNEFEIENKRQEIFVRVKQSIFRKLVLENFNKCCCVSDITEEDLLIASHIVPWCDNKGSRLDPTNGLCLSVLYDKLFDRGYFTLDDSGSIVTIQDISGLSLSLINTLQSIRGRKINSPLKAIKIKYIKYHRENIFIERHKYL